jgi:multiple sugar transport system ATP-binding protein
MTALSLRQIGKTYPSGPAVITGLNLEITAGEFMVFVGPSGCGKTTLLRMIAGLEDITAGELLFGDEDVTDAPPAQRGAAMVFQSYALYPHMTVAQNLGFGLRMAGVGTAEREAAIKTVATTLQITHLLDRKPKALSGGQRQRVAIGRAIVRKPKVFLFDEPLSNLDANLRVQMRVELSRLHQQLGTTMVYVTHDQVEAMTLGQRIAVFNAGRIEQVGTPLQLYHQPANRFVAEFIGSPRMNILPCRLKTAVGAVGDVGAFGAFGDVAEVAEAGVWALPPDGVNRQAVHCVGIRCEDLGVQALGPQAVHNNVHTAPGVQAQISLVEQLGDSTLVHLQVAGVDTPVVARLAGSVDMWRSGQAVRLVCAPDKLHCFDKDGAALR